MKYYIKKFVPYLLTSVALGALFFAYNINAQLSPVSVNLHGTEGPAGGPSNWREGSQSDPIIITGAREHLIYLTWESTNATDCRLEDPIHEIPNSINPQQPYPVGYLGGNTWIQFDINGKSNQGTIWWSPSNLNQNTDQTMQYSITCTGTDGSTATDSVYFKLLALKVPVITVNPTLSCQTFFIDWRTYTDDGNAYGYNVYRDGVKIKTLVPPFLSYNPYYTDRHTYDKVSNVGQVYTYRVSAINFKGIEATSLAVSGQTDDACPVVATDIDLIASPPTPSVATVGKALNFSSIISNTGGASTGTSFKNFFQISDTANGSGKITDLTSSSTPALGAGANVSISSPSYVFPLIGTYSVRACADKSSAANTGTITESDEGNNCSAWTDVVVTNLGTCSDGILNQNETSIDLGGVCGTCSDGIKNGNETGTDSGGRCGVLLPDLIASAPTQTTAIVNVAQTYTSTITNQGNATTGKGFTNLFQTSQSSTGASGVVDHPVAGMNALGVGGTANISTSITFPSVGTWYIRACADKSSAANTGTITESDEGNNCSMSTPWTAVDVIDGTCFDGIKNGNETGIDTGGRCTLNVCSGGLGTCYDGIKNADETATDSGGRCGTSGNCYDGIKNSDETGIDTGGRCLNYGNCTDGVQNGDETGIDTGGHCTCFGSCFDGIQNADETGIDSGGRCGVFVVNGSCSTSHYSCLFGDSVNNVDGLSAWTWDCNSSTGGTDQSCTESKNSLMTGTLVSAAPSCIIAVNNSSCTIDFSWSTTKPVAVSAVTSNIKNDGTPANNTLVAPGNNGTDVAFVVPHDNRTFFLYNNLVELDRATVFSNCGINIWDGTKCVVDPGGGGGGGDSGTCYDGIKNGNENSIDSGGRCGTSGNCYDGTQNGNETGVDTGGRCVGKPPIPGCRNGATNPPTCTLDGGDKNPLFIEN